MTAAGFQMRANDLFEVRVKGTVPIDRSGIGWNDSSWERRHGLDVVEDLPPEAWPLEPLALQPAQAA